MLGFSIIGFFSYYKFSLGTLCLTIGYIATGISLFCIILLISPVSVTGSSSPIGDISISNKSSIYISLKLRDEHKLGANDDPSSSSLLPDISIS